MTAYSGVREVPEPKQLQHTISLGLFCVLCEFWRSQKHMLLSCNACRDAKFPKVATSFSLPFTRQVVFADGLLDCEDPECCSNHICRSSQLCVSAPKPIDILLRKQPPAITASFFERMKFLIEEGSLQNYARQESFNER